MRTLLTLIAVGTLTAVPALAQDPVEVDPDHYKVEFENEYVRVLRISYGPNEESVMHYHPGHVAILINDQKWQFTLPNGETVEIVGKAGETIWAEPGKHRPKNMSDQPGEAIAIEIKSSVKDDM